MSELPKIYRSKIEKNFSNEEFQLFANKTIPVLEENKEIISQLETN